VTPVTGKASTAGSDRIVERRRAVALARHYRESEGLSIAQIADRPCGPRPPAAPRLLVSHGAIELWSWTLAPGDRRESEGHRPGSVELLAVNTGTVALDVGHHRAVVAAGDSAWFDATLPHSYANPETTLATFALVLLEPA
jgi:mannose-6-phosphate isomerase-like protein (cupin superfamily)